MGANAQTGAAATEVISSASRHVYCYPGAPLLTRILG